MLVYEYDQATGKWDGMNQSEKEAPAGPYYYHLTARDYAGQLQERSGVVYLIRDLIELSPNPAKDKLVIKMNGRLPGERSLQIISANGAVITSQILPAQNECQLDISQLKSGLYMLVINNGIESQSISFIKNKPKTIMMKKILPILLLFFIYHQKDLLAQMDYNQNVVFTTGLNVPAQMVFDTDGILFVANHSYASYPGEYSNTIARIDESGNKTVFVSGLTWPSGLTIDKEQNLYFDQNNAGTTVYKVSPDGTVQPFVSLPHMPGPITLYDNGNPELFALYSVSNWDSQGLYKTDHNGLFNLIDPGAFEPVYYQKTGSICIL
ncbi:MAG: T9SS type A sorting domain-containing protein [Bacteroidales bacterium]|nr:T9SS type A sorting domain-containing protein [Bacteroidales bacterium]